MTGNLIEFQSYDGLRLAARDYPGPPGGGVVLCLHGLTRNSRDFMGLAGILTPRYRILAPDQRGRGLSDHDPEPANYNVLTQTRDVWALLDREGVDRCVVVGTSMGALMSIVMANGQPDRIAGLVLNDAGPEVDPRGLARITGYVGKGRPLLNWDDAATTLREVHGDSFPSYGHDDWLRMARATYAEGPDGALGLAYDPALARAFAGGGGMLPDMWPMFEILTSIPALVVRGELSDILAESTATEMAARFPLTRLVTVPDRGHAPELVEPTAVAAIQDFLTRPEVIARL